MVGTGKGKNRRSGSLLLLILFGLGLACLALPEAAESGVATAWVRSYKKGGEPKAMTLDSLGNIYITGRYTIKYNPQGQRIWVRHFNEGGAPGDAVAITVDGQGNVYVTGAIQVIQNTLAFDYATIKYSPEGQQLWVRQYDGPAKRYDAPKAIALDALGNVYVTGESERQVDRNKYTRDFTTIKYSPDGEEMWVRRYGGGAYALAVDVHNNVYVTGTSYEPGKNYDFATIKYNSDGDLLWEQRYDGPANGYDYPRAIALDGQGNVHVTGQSQGDYATIKYSPDGEELWVRRYDGPANGNDDPRAMALDGRGNVYITGISEAPEGDSWYDYATIKYSADGKLLWEHLYSGPGRDFDEPRALAVDAQGNVYVTGYSTGADGGWDYATIKYNTDGRRGWVRRYGGQAGNSQAEAMAVDAQGNVYVTGYSSYYYVTIKYTQTP